MSLLSVSELNEQIKSLLESTFMQVRVRGEVSRVTYHTSGHLYFTVKDKKSALGCVMFRSNAAKMRFRLEEGMRVVLFGAVTVYVPRGNYQLMVQSVEPDGEGALAVAFEQLKKRLADEGLFERKKPLPKRVRHVVLVTSKTGAAVQDMIRVASRRWPLVRLTVVDTLVQGAEAGLEIARHLAYADRLGADVIVLGRGGGSREDLWAFNEEVVARAVFACQTPVVSAVGHEVDTLITDFVADLRAPTPSAAMEMILPSAEEVLMGLDERMDRLKGRMGQIVTQKELALKALVRQLEAHSVSHRVERGADEVARMKRGLDELGKRYLAAKASRLGPLRLQTHMAVNHLTERKTALLNATLERLKALDPATKARPGFAQVSRQGRVVKLADLRAGERVTLSDGRYKATAKIETLENLV
ncbi:MAG: exodeoxyribonuclease VII large subunit [Epsilonproteobacteria bacterium]|nr:exodeoxyribonuclease VII large subunit [Campylobacterota bacterium]